MTHSFPQRRSSDLNLHLLTGKIATPGNSPFSLTGQPSACGTAREVGTFSHRLPADLVVMNPAHRATAEKIWKIPAGTIQEKPGLHAVAQNRALKDRTLNAYWVQVNKNIQASATHGNERDRKRVVEGKDGTGRVTIGGAR